MSNRTNAASTAIRKAWERERQLVLEGNGTRDWTPEQQQSILDMGKVYDDDGKAFEGHHMKSADAYPEFQGYPGNIQFLSRNEHKDAHDGDFHNPTNGYYDPVTRTTKQFPPDSFEPCAVILLSQQRPPLTVVQKVPLKRAAPPTKPATKKASPTKKSALEHGREVVGKALSWCAKHQEQILGLVTAAKMVRATLGAARTETAPSMVPDNASPPRHAPPTDDDADAALDLEDLFDPLDDEAEDALFDLLPDICEAEAERYVAMFPDENPPSAPHNYPLERKSAKLHTRRGHLRHLGNGKIVQVSPTIVGQKKGNAKPGHKKAKEK